MQFAKEHIDTLVEFGYLTVEPERDFSVAEIEAATKQLQAYYGLPTTGQWDEMTSRAVKRTPRCGCVDAGFAAEVMAKWGTRDLNYFIESHVTGVGLSTAAVEGVFKQAYDDWSAVCGLVFKRVSSRDNAHIVMTKGRGRWAGFDGASGTLAYAYLPQGNNYQGQLELVFDMDEPWSIGGAGGTIDLLAVTEHELGHTFGMDHTQTPGQLMLAFYNVAIRKPQNEDAQRAVSRYGPPRVTPVPPPVPRAPGGLTKLELMVRVNGSLTLGPYDLDLLKRGALLAGAGS